MCGRCHTLYDNCNNRGRRGMNHTGIVRESKDRLLDRAKRRNKIHFYSYMKSSSICNHISDNKYNTELTENVSKVTCKHCLSLITKKY